MGAFGLALEAWHLGEELGGVTPERGPVEEPRRADRDVDRGTGQLTLVPEMKEPVGDLIVGEQVRRPLVVARQVSNAGSIDLLRVLGFAADG